MIYVADNKFALKNILSSKGISDHDAHTPLSQILINPRFHSVYPNFQKWRLKSEGTITQIEDSFHYDFQSRMSLDLEKFKHINKLQIGVNESQPLNRITLKNVNLLVSNGGYTVFRDNYILDVSTALPRFAPEQVELNNGLFFKYGFFVGDQSFNNNICHSTFDHIGRAIYAYEKLGISKECIAFPQPQLDYQRYIKECIFPNSISLPIYNVFHFKTLELFPYFSEFHHPARHCDKLILTTLRYYICRLKSRSEKKNRLVYLTRKNASNARKLVNEEELEFLLSNLGFEIINMGELDPKEQVWIAENSRIIVAPHGAALTSIAFSHAPCHILELFNPHVGTLVYYKLAYALGLDYSYVLGTPQMDFDGTSSSWQVNIDEVKEKLMSII